MLSGLLARMWLPLLLGAVFQITEIFFIGLKGPRTSAPARDRGSATLLMLASQGGAMGGYLYAAFSASPAYLVLPLSVRLLGAVITCVGLGIRVWSARTLGRFFTRRVRVAEDQVVVEGGPYRLVRHPAYTGFLLVGLGVGLSLGNVVSLVLLVVPTLAATIYRVSVEEVALVEGLGPRYAAYMTRTKRFVPYLY